MGCDFKPGDDLVVIEGCTAAPVVLTKMQVVTVLDVKDFGDGEGARVFLVGIDNGDETGLSRNWFGFPPSRFRKVERKNDRLSIEAFMTMPGGFEEPRRAPAKKRERA